MTTRETSIESGWLIKQYDQFDIAESVSDLLGLHPTTEPTPVLNILLTTSTNHLSATSALKVQYL